jgi:hypothetical protein
MVWAYYPIRGVRRLLKNLRAESLRLRHLRPRVIKPGTSFADNARKRANRPDIKDRVIEIATVTGVAETMTTAYLQRRLAGRHCVVRESRFPPMRRRAGDACRSPLAVKHCESP